MFGEFILKNYLEFGLVFAIIYCFMVGLFRPNYSKSVVALSAALVIFIYPALFLGLILMGIVKLGSLFSTKN